MGRKAKYSKQFKLIIIKRYLKGESATTLRNEYGMSKIADNKIFEQAHKYEILGEEGFDTSSKNKSYSKEFKEKVISEYLNDEISYSDLANKYNISTK